MTGKEIIKNLRQIQQLIKEDSPYIASERINFLVHDIEKAEEK